MKRKIISIDKDLCDGCGVCVDACHEGAIAMVDGKARLISDIYCDGLGDCLPECPAGAICMTVREAAAYDRELVQRRMAEKGQGGCPSAAARQVERKAPVRKQPEGMPRALGTWPVQIKLAPAEALYFEGARLLITADCTAYAYANLHREFMEGRATLIGCPKLDGEDYSDKLAEIFARNDIQSVTVLRMEVPCCAGIVNAAKEAVGRCGKVIPWGFRTISIDGRLLD